MHNQSMYILPDEDSLDDIITRDKERLNKWSKVKQNNQLSAEKRQKQKEKALKHLQDKDKKVSLLINQRYKDMKEKQEKHQQKLDSFIDRKKRKEKELVVQGESDYNNWIKQIEKKKEIELQKKKKENELDYKRY